MDRKFTLSMVALFALSTVTPVLGQTYPAKPVRIIVPFAAGGGSDVVARLLGPELTRAWGQPMIVDNRAGAGGIIGAEYVFRSAPDGYTMLLVETSGLTIRSNLYKLPFDLLKDFTGVAVVAYGPNVLVAHPSVPARTVRDLVALAKQRPGELNFAIPGAGSVAHLAGVELEQTVGIKLSYIPYKGGGPAIVDLISGRSISRSTACWPHCRMSGAGSCVRLPSPPGSRIPHYPAYLPSRSSFPGMRVAPGRRCLRLRQYRRTSSPGGMPRSPASTASPRCRSGWPRWVRCPSS